MERTRHLTLTEEEKQEHTLAEFKKSLSGLIQRCQDGALAPYRFKEDLGRLQAGSHVTDEGIVLDEISKRWDLGGDNSWAYNLLEAFGIDPQGITTVCDEYLKALDRASMNRIHAIRKELGEKHGIQGTAVFPNLASDLEWTGENQRLQEHYESLLAREFKKMKRSLNP
jgi:hypothetical protein